MPKAPSLTAKSVALLGAAHQLLDSGTIFADPLAVPICGEDALGHNGPLHGGLPATIANIPTGRAGTRAPRTLFEYMKTLMPDMAISIEDMFGERDKVCVRWRRFKATVTGSFGEQKGDDSRCEAMAFSIYRFQDGRIAEEWRHRSPGGPSCRTG